MHCTGNVCEWLRADMFRQLAQFLVVHGTRYNG